MVRSLVRGGWDFVAVFFRCCFFILCEGFWAGVVVDGDGIALNEYILLTAFSHNLLRFQFKLLLLLFTLLVLLLRRL